MKVLLTASISAMMIKDNAIIIREITEKQFKKIIKKVKFESFVGHEKTAKILSKKFKIDIKFNRQSIQFSPTTIILSAIPNMRFETSREYTAKEIKNAKFRYFIAYEIDFNWIKRILINSSDVWTAEGIMDYIKREVIE